jgi:hypothetical protein
MGCCGGKACDSKKEALERAELSAAPITALVPKLMEVLKTGIFLWSFKDSAADQLAASIANLVRENDHLKSLLKIFCAPAPDVSATAKSVYITFGPANAYTLHIAATTPDVKAALADSLRKAADELCGENPPSPQMQFDWDLQ